MVEGGGAREGVEEEDYVEGVEMDRKWADIVWLGSIYLRRETGNTAPGGGRRRKRWKHAKAARNVCPAAARL